MNPKKPAYTMNSHNQESDQIETEFKPMVTYVQNIMSPDASPLPCSLHALMLAIANQSYAHLVDPCRENDALANKDILDQRKKQLPAFTVSGTYDPPLAKAHDEGRFRHNGCLQADFDQKDNPDLTVERMMEILQKCPHVLYAYRSASGRGAKAIVRVPRSLHLHAAAFETAVAHFADLGLVMDRNCSNTNRFSYVSADSQMWMNPLAATVLEPDEDILFKKAEAGTGRGIQRSHQAMEENLARDLLRQIPTNLGYQDWLRVSQSVLAATSNEVAVRLLNEWWPEDSPRRYAKLFQHRLEKIGPGTLWYYARQFRKDSAPTPFAFKSPPQHVTGLEDENEDDEAPSEAFPLHALPDAARKMAEEIARVSTSRSDRLAAGSVLGVLSAAVGAGAVCKVDGEHDVRANLFIMAAAESGVGKSESLKHARSPLDMEEKKLRKRFDNEQKPLLTAELRKIDQEVKALSAPPKQEGPPIANSDHLAQLELRKAELGRKLAAPPRLIVGDTTKEALACIMERQPGEAIASISGEARGILNIVKGRYAKKGGDEDFYTAAYSGDPYHADRINRDAVLLSSPCLCLLWMVQPDAARDAFADETLAASGFMPRILYFNAETAAKPRHEDVPAIKPEVKNEWEHLIAELMGTFHLSREAGAFSISISKAARFIYRNYANQCINRRAPDGPLHDMASYVARWAENAARIALVLHCAAHKAHATSIELAQDTMINAIQIMGWFSRRQLEALAASRTSRSLNHLNQLKGYIQQEAAGCLTMRDAKRKHNLGKEEIENLVKEFPGHLQIHASSGKPGRPSRFVTLRHGSEVPAG